MVPPPLLCGVLSQVLRRGKSLRQSPVNGAAITGRSVAFADRPAGLFWVGPLGSPAVDLRSCVPVSLGSARRKDVRAREGAGGKKQVQDALRTRAEIDAAVLFPVRRLVSLGLVRPHGAALVHLAGAHAGEFVGARPSTIAGR